MTLKRWGPTWYRAHSAWPFWLQSQRITPQRQNTFKRGFTVIHHLYDTINLLKKTTYRLISCVCKTLPCIRRNSVHWDIIKDFVEWPSWKAMIQSIIPSFNFELPIKLLAWLLIHLFFQPVALGKVLVFDRPQFYRPLDLLNDKWEARFSR